MPYSNNAAGSGVGAGSGGVGEVHDAPASPFSPTATNQMILMDATAADQTVNLPPAQTGVTIIIHKKDVSAVFNINIIADGSETIVGNATLPLTGTLRPTLALVGILGVGWIII